MQAFSLLPRIRVGLTALRMPSAAEITSFQRANLAKACRTNGYLVDWQALSGAPSEPSGICVTPPGVTQLAGIGVLSH